MLRNLLLSGSLLNLLATQIAAQCLGSGRDGNCLPLQTVASVTSPKSSRTQDHHRVQRRPGVPTQPDPGEIGGHFLWNGFVQKGPKPLPVAYPLPRLRSLRPFGARRRDEFETNRNVLPPLGGDLLNTALLKQNLPPQQILINSNNIRRKQANPKWRADKDQALPPFNQQKFERDYDESVSGDIDSSISSSSSGDKDLFQHGIRNVREEAALKRVMIPLPESATIFAPPAPPPLPAGQVLPDNIHQLLNVPTLPTPPLAQINKNQVLDDSDVEEHDLKSSEFEKIDPDRLLPIREMHTTEVPPAPLTDIDLLHLAESLSPTIQPNSEELLKIIRKISPESVVDQHGRSIDILKITRSHSPNNLSPTIEDFDDISAGVSKPEKSKKLPKEAENSIEMAMAGFGKKDSDEIENPSVDILKVSKNGPDSPAEKEEVAFKIEETDGLKVVQRNSPNSEDEENSANTLKVEIGTSPNVGKLEKTDMVKVRQGESPNKRTREMGLKKRQDMERVKNEKEKFSQESIEDEANEVDILKVRHGKSPTKNRTEESEAGQPGSDSEEKEKPEKPKRSRKESSKNRPEPENNADVLKVSRGNSPNREKAAHGSENEEEETDTFEVGKREGESEEQPTDKKKQSENETDILKVSRTRSPGEIYEEVEDRSEEKATKKPKILKIRKLTTPNSGERTEAAKEESAEKPKVRQNERERLASSFVEAEESEKPQTKEYEQQQPAQNKAKILRVMQGDSPKKSKKSGHKHEAEKLLEPDVEEDDAKYNRKQKHRKPKKSKRPQTPADSEVSTEHKDPEIMKIRKGTTPSLRETSVEIDKSDDFENAAKAQRSPESHEIASQDPDFPAVDILKVSQAVSPNRKSKKAWIQRVQHIAKGTSPNHADHGDLDFDAEEEDRPSTPRKRAGFEFENYGDEDEEEKPKKESKKKEKNSKKSKKDKHEEEEQEDEEPKKHRKGDDHKNENTKKSKEENTESKSDIRNKNIASKAALKDAPNVKYYYPPKTHLPLPVCFYNPTGYACCNVKLNNLIENTYSEIKASPKYNACNIQIIANKIQEAAQNEFSHPFETVAALGDFAQNVHFAGDLVCKVEIDGKYMLAYGSPYKADMAHNATGPMMQRLALFSLRI